MIWVAPLARTGAASSSGSRSARPRRQAEEEATVPMSTGDRLRDGGEAAVDLAVELEAALHHRRVHGVSVPHARERRADGEISWRRGRARTPLDAATAVDL